MKREATRQERVEPNRKLRPRQYTAHQICFDERRREKVFAPRFPRRGNVSVLAVVRHRAFDDQRLQLWMAGRAGVVKRQRETEGGVRMYAGANRIGLLGQE